MESEFIIALVIYKVATLAVGLAFGYMGFRLFIAGVSGSAGDLKGSHKGFRFSLVNAAPGTFFAITGAVIVGTTIWKGMELHPGAYSPTHHVGQGEIPPLIKK